LKESFFDTYLKLNNIHKNRTLAGSCEKIFTSSETGAEHQGTNLKFAKVHGEVQIRGSRPHPRLEPAPQQVKIFSQLEAAEWKTQGKSVN